MKTPPAIDFPEGGTPAERLDMAFRKVLTVPKEAILKEEALERQEREKKRANESSPLPRDGNLGAPGRKPKANQP